MRLYCYHLFAYILLLQVEDTIGETSADGCEVAVTLRGAASPGVWIREPGSDIATGQVVLHKG